MPTNCYSQILENDSKGKMSALLTVEEGGTTKGEVSYLRTLYRLGVRMLTLTWNYPNELGYPNTITKQGQETDWDGVNTENGLTQKGLEFLEEMQQLGMIIDVSHLSDAGFLFRPLLLSIVPTFFPLNHFLIFVNTLSLEESTLHLLLIHDNIDRLK